MITKIWRACVFALLVCSCSTASFYGDLHLGGDYYYAIHPFNSVELSISESPTSSSITVIPEQIDSLAYNDQYILAINLVAGKKAYWIIDKEKEPRKLEYLKEEKRYMFANVLGPIDSMQFHSLTKQIQITMKSRSYYRKNAGY